MAYDDKTEAQIQRQHSQQMAIEYCKLLLACGQLKNTDDFGTQRLEEFTNYFDDDIKLGAARALGADSSPAPTGEEEPARPQNPKIPADRVKRIRSEIGEKFGKAEMDQVGDKLKSLGAERVDGLDTRTAELFETWLKAA